VSASNLDESWELKAACRGPHTDLFFPPDHFEKKTEREFRERQAKSICAECPVQEECLKYALRINEQHGVWGGKNEAERRALMESAAS
jgi:WhiB family transcriptional regulator, redox-sensing transcriptional regulator